MDLLVICHPGFLYQVKKLAGFKSGSGISTAVVTTDGVEAHCLGRDLAEKMKKCAGDYMKKRGTTSLLLVGSPDLVPTRYAFCPDLEYLSVEEALRIEKRSRRAPGSPEYERYYVPTDLYYANQADDWDINRNGVYGEVRALTGLDRDEGGFTSQLAVGRIPARRESDLALVVDKIARYQPLETLHALFISATRDAGREFEGDAWIEHLIPELEGGWTVKVVGEGHSQCNAKGISGLLDEGEYSIVVAVTHGLPFALVVDSLKRLQVLDSRRVDLAGAESVMLESEKIKKAEWYSRELLPALLDTRAIAGLKNDGPFFFLGFGCYISAFDYRPHYSVVGQFVMQEHGAIAACGLSRDVPAVMYAEYQAALNRTGGLQFEIGDSMLLNLCNRKMAFGSALGRSLGDYAEKHPELMGLNAHRRAAFGMTLVGDPTLSLFR